MNFHTENVHEIDECNTTTDLLIHSSCPLLMLNERMAQLFILIEYSCAYKCMSVTAYKKIQ